MLLFKVVGYFVSGIFRVVLLGYLVVVAAEQSAPVDYVRSYVSNMTIGEMAHRVNYEIKDFKEKIEKDEDGKIALLISEIKQRSDLL